MSIEELMQMYFPYRHVTFMLYLLSHLAAGLAADQTVDYQSVDSTTPLTYAMSMQHCFIYAILGSLQLASFPVAETICKSWLSKSTLDCGQS